MVANGIPIVGPNASELLDEGVLTVVLHLVEEVKSGEVQLSEDLLEGDDGKFGLEEVGPIKAIEAVGPKDCLLLV